MTLDELLGAVYHATYRTPSQLAVARQKLADALANDAALSAEARDRLAQLDAFAAKIGENLMPERDVIGHIHRQALRLALGT